VWSDDLDERILKMLDDSSELMDEIKKRYPDAGVFHKENGMHFEIEDNYLDRAMEDDHRLKRLGEECLEKIAQGFYGKYSTGDIFEGEAYKAHCSHSDLAKNIVDSLDEHMATFARESEDCGHLIKEMIEIEVECYRKTAS
jgi:hypothetical protein